MSQILQMLSLQQQLNDATNGENWEEGVTKNGKKIDWRRCIYLEAAELVESYPWKHWKN
ncbi:MAG: dUTP diphosphatase, partial [Sulfurovaceae bacterium]|nr:dUTP diphosphatase [Sulfurovaceae bacterium]